jgi:hypothetical protein
MNSFAKLSTATNVAKVVMMHHLLTSELRP